MKLTVLCLVFLFQLKKIGSVEWLTPCTTDAGCVNLINATCRDGLCVCNNSFLVCQLANRLGTSCNASNPCATANSKCLRQKCMCEDGFVSSGDLRRCLQIVKNVDTDPCEQKYQCPEARLCQSGKCVRGLDSMCELDTDCAMVDSSSCVNLRCKCDDGFVRINQRCLKAAGLGEGCESDSQCAAVSGTICMGRKCVKNPYLQNSCMKDEDCQQSGQVNYLECKGGFCICKPNSGGGACSDIISLESTENTKTVSMSPHLSISTFWLFLLFATTIHLN